MFCKAQSAKVLNKIILNCLCSKNHCPDAYKENSEATFSFANLQKNALFMRNTIGSVGLYQPTFVLVFLPLWLLKFSL
jgi:hypothetical protein